jgi:chromosome transmission fidelity protein 18
VLIARRDIDQLAIFETASDTFLTSQAPTRYAVRQVLDQELQKTIALRENAARQARFKAGNPHGHDEVVIHDDKENQKSIEEKEKFLGPTLKRDFFGRVIEAQPLQELDANTTERKKRRTSGATKDQNKVWVTFREGLNNAVSKPISLQEFLRGL